MSGGFWQGVLWGMGFCRDEERRRSKRCPHCERRIPMDAKYCPYCGKELLNEAMKPPE